MGRKGDKMTNEAQLTVELFLEKLSSLQNITSKKMFGGYGIFHLGKMFAMVDSKGKAFLKSDASSKVFFERKSCQKHSRMPYYAIPEKVLNDSKTLAQWALMSIKIPKDL